MWHAKHIGRPYNSIKAPGRHPVGSRHRLGLGVILITPFRDLHRVSLAQMDRIMAGIRHTQR